MDLKKQILVALGIDKEVSLEYQDLDQLDRLINAIKKNY